MPIKNLILIPRNSLLHHAGSTKSSIAAVKLTLQLTLLPIALAHPISSANDGITDTTTAADSNFETIVVTGTRTEHNFLEAPVKVEVISQEQLKQQHAFDLSEGIKTLPGIQLKSVEGKEGLEAWIQGISANRVLVLIDGEPVSASTGSSVDLTQIAVTDVARIEVVKGAASVLYGSQALGGVINVITQQPKEGWHGRISIDGGSYGDRNSNGDDLDIARQRTAAQVSFANEQFFAKADLNLRLSDGFKIDPNIWPQQGPDGHRNTATLLAGFTPTDDQLYTLRYENYDQELHSQLFFGKNLDDKIDNAQRQRLSFKADVSHDAHQWIVKAYHEEYETDSMPNRGKTRQSDMPMSQIDAQWSYALSEQHQLTAGALLFEESLYQKAFTRSSSVTEIDDESRDNQEAFVQLEALHGPWTIVPGVRVQEDSDFGSHISPKISLRHDTTEQLFFRFSLGDGYRVPNLKERFYLFDHSHIGYILLGNPELKPEESISAQASVTFTDYSRFQAEFALFRNELTDLIELEPVRFEQGVQYYEYTNVQEAITQGIELSGSYAFAFGLKVQGGYTYLYSKNITRGHELNDRPEHQIKTSLNYSSSFGLDVSLIASWQSKAKEFYYDRDQVTLLNVYETDAWSQLDLKISQEVYASAHQTFSVYGGIDNITDEIQDFSAPFDNRPEVGRVVYLGATYEF